MVSSSNDIIACSNGLELRYSTNKNNTNTNTNITTTNNNNLYSAIWLKDDSGDWGYIFYLYFVNSAKRVYFLRSRSAH